MNAERWAEDYHQRYRSGVGFVPPDAKALVIASEVNLTTMTRDHQLGLVRVTGYPTMSGLAAREGGSTVAVRQPVDEEQDEDDHEDHPDRDEHADERRGARGPVQQTLEPVGDRPPRLVDGRRLRLAVLGLRELIPEPLLTLPLVRVERHVEAEHQSRR